jgi:hypothetical protein
MSDGSSSSEKKEKKADKKRAPFRTARFNGARCAMCGVSNTEKKLRDCARCGLAAYCSQECQKLGYKEHRLWCKMSAAENSADDADGSKKILFSRVFGGAASMLLKHGREKYGRGMISVTCSHRVSEFCDRRRTEDGQRSLTLTYVPDGKPVLDLQLQSLGEQQAQHDADGPGAVELAMYQADKFGEHCYTNISEDPDQGTPPDRFVIIGLQSPHKRYIETIIFFSWMSMSHPAHLCFKAVASDSITLDWEGLQDDPLQWLCRNAVGPQFYNDTTLVWQKKWESKDTSPWPDGALSPPLCWSVSLLMLPPGHVVKNGHVVKQTSNGP